MAAGPFQSCYGLCELHFFLFLMVLCDFLASDSVAVRVTQEPLFASNSQEKTQTFHCSIDGENYNFYWYRQLPGEAELQVVGSLYTHNTELQDVGSTWSGRLTGQWVDTKRAMTLHLTSLHPDDTGLYLCAARDTESEAGSEVAAKPSVRNRDLTAAFLCTVEKTGLERLRSNLPLTSA
nr:V-set and immunoglobulin domain-containing protein 2-like [Pogona vitticeps]